ncbi:hypothetical protein ACFVWN_20855 [Nocardiopsis flavescens]|uniref:Ribonuclease toxin, BrnT, of type II toxin-antitoxin system n=1 Tax=Nocardiopsis flavescens TaxID=758803 RepID=A0A1M6IFM1_9ACTN|nr:hypothetical protein [Nocardiopsis flavescens]SHJ33215.1 Ribonuclease toxin, BrnT, of type II toxin-antitoxin system [Nocardiopsis flavescens]
MKLWIHWTERSEAHIARHDVEPYEVEETAEAPYLAFPGREGCTILLGRTHAGRHLTVVMVEATDEHRSWYIVTARDMTRAERRRFERKHG